jgi:transposase
MDILTMYRRGLNISEIARRTGHTRKTVRKYVRTKQPPTYKPRPKRPSILDPYKPYLRQRMGEGVFNCSKLWDEIKSQGYPGGKTILKEFVKPYRDARKELATVRFETGPGEQAQIDWAHFGRIFHEGRERKLYAFIMTLGYSRAMYLEFTTSQDTEHFFQCQMNAFRYFGGVPEEVLVDNLKSAVLWRDGPRVGWNPRYLDFAAHYGFIPRACWPYRAQTKGKTENGVGYVRGNFWVGLRYLDLADLNEQARSWLDGVANVRLHQTTRAVPFERLREERGHLIPIDEVAPYDPSYVSQRKVTKDCLVSYQGVRYSVPHRYVGKVVTIREPVEGGVIHIHFQGERIATHPKSWEKGAFVIDEEHYKGLWPGRDLSRRENSSGEGDGIKLPAGPGIGLSHVAPVVEERSLEIYELVVLGPLWGQGGGS